MSSAGQGPEADGGGLEGFAGSAATRPFWEALGRGELLIPYCAACERSFFPPREICPACGGEEVSLRPAAGVGTVLAASTARLPLNGWPEDDLPYTALLVELRDEGIVLPGRSATVIDESPVGAAVELDFSVDSKDRLPRWRIT